MRFKPLAWALALLLSLPSAAQSDDLLRNGELLLAAGGMSYIGDLNNQSALGMPHGAAAVGLRYRLDNRWALRFELACGSIASPEKDYIRQRNLSFRSDIWELSGVGEFNFAPFGGPNDRLWTPYIFGGLAVFYFNPMASYVRADGSTAWAELQPLHTEGQGSQAYSGRQPYRLVQVSLPFGVGVKVRLSKVFTVAAQYGFRKTWTDYLDDVSTTYVEPSVLLANADDGALAVQLADRSGEVTPGFSNAPGIKRGDDSLDDWYSFFNLSVGVSLETLFGWTQKKRCKLNN